METKYVITYIEKASMKGLPTYCCKYGEYKCDGLISAKKFDTEEQAEKHLKNLEKNDMKGELLNGEVVEIKKRWVLSI